MEIGGVTASGEIIFGYEQNDSFFVRINFRSCSNKTVRNKIQVAL